MTIQRMAVVDKDNNVVNVIVYDTEATWAPPEGTRLIQDKKGEATPGGIWDGEQFVVPIESKPAWWQKQ